MRNFGDICPLQMDRPTLRGALTNRFTPCGIIVWEERCTREAKSSSQHRRFVAIRTPVSPGGRPDPSLAFDTLGYLAANPDIAAAGVNLTTASTKAGRRSPTQCGTERS